MEIAVTVQTNCKQEALIVKNGAIKIKLRAKAIDGAANKALVKFLARQLSVPASSVIIIQGQRSRHKVIELPDSAALLTETLL